MLLFALAAGLAGHLFVWAGPARAQQPALIGSSDDPRENIQQVWWERRQVLDVMGGFSLIGAQWRTATSFTLDLDTRPVLARLRGTLRAGIYGTYRPDVDEAYDLLRLLEFARYNAPSRARFYLRGGPLQRMRLGTGHVVDFFNSDVAWDERTVGLEMMWQGAALEVSGFTDNVLFDGVTGGRLALTPFFRVRDPRLRSLQLGAGYVTDLAPHPDGVPRFTAYSADARFVLLRSGALLLAPFLSYTRYEHFGDGLLLGADLYADNFIDLARFHFRLALFYNGRQFIPAYVGPFYQVNSLRARILKAEDFDESNPQAVFAGVPLAAAGGGNDLMTELRILLFSGFEFYYAFRRHYGARALSTFHFRLYLRARRFSLYLGQDRGGLRGFFSLFNDLGDLTALVFQTDYRFLGDFRVFARARYTYERLDDGDDGTERYLVQRRFEPFTGLRLTF
ncbi:hypothetical protein GQ464_001940 [Rhodocaloribacter litoris]|uniref:hypothetical protein n=1 Tax=Rhodocaloribacter litoris TaxID=2558931 RepID=UPI0014238573|nr:hypothetical protein [Rhodocaloribacter litoris]QXD15730.1 hypothetical protein GQ464_001940 [Rhodocaloribacter litoris]